MENVTGECEMQIDLEALCKVYLLTKDSEFCSILDSKAECEGKKQKARAMFFDKDLSEKEAEEYASTFRCGMMQGMVEIFSMFMNLIGRELGDEGRMFQKTVGYVCPRCKDKPLYPNCDHIPVMDALYTMSYECLDCGYKYEFPKAALVRDIFTEYTQKKEEKE